MGLLRFMSKIAIIDVLRSIAHELVHYKQNLEGRLIDAAKDGSDGSPIENEANAVAGVIMKYGKIHMNNNIRQLLKEELLISERKTFFQLTHCKL
jgi:hypothetical protein